MQNYLWVLLLTIILLGTIILFFEQPPIDQNTTANGTLKLISPGFNNNDRIPQKYTCQGENISPPLEISGIPKRTKSLVLTLEDPDAPLKTWTHWIVYNLPPENISLAENSLPEEAMQGENSWEESNYGGPCPPSGEHHYILNLYALDKTLEFSRTPKKSDIESSMRNHVLDHAQLTGIYSKE
ncbi:MAG: YbhB/YbcL family Raf kinase inhibitor-like protein [Nanoarchaeota archaeon]|nr:YbhB/YbcL family Raf kinase inhibitor-like protein [Nanoarchaeota archaeon]MBU0977983.1 YbhB/YbcL family Raf kinase inhibitor-like protein [Nanoarchaeota archaeon]